MFTAMTAADLRWSCNELCIGQGPKFGANVFWQSFLIWGLGSQPWKFPQQMYQKKQEKLFFQYNVKFDVIFSSIWK